MLTEERQNYLHQRLLYLTGREPVEFAAWYGFLPQEDREYVRTWIAGSECEGLKQTLKEVR